MLDIDLPGAVETPQSELVAAQERICGLEAQVELLRGQLEQERQRNAGLVEELKAVQPTAAQKRSSPWWRFWQHHGQRAANGPANPFVN